ncbi:MAG: hypothetical protein IJK56_03240 [Firmicutes bacterium]|nr:hypothetical protein [Bacillota bacterium]
MSVDSYEDIIHLPHPVSRKHKPMSLHDRAAQFAPFAALTGYEDMVEETARQTDPCKDLEEDARELLDARFALLCMDGELHPQIRVTYFNADKLKDGGAYLTVSGILQSADTEKRLIRMQDGSRIRLEDIIDIDGPLFLQTEWQDN